MCENENDLFFRACIKDTDESALSNNFQSIHMMFLNSNFSIFLSYKHTCAHDHEGFFISASESES